MDKKVLLLGLGMSGKSAAKLLLAQGVTVDAVDDKVIDDPSLSTLIEKGLRILSQPDVKQYSMLVVSPGIPQNHPLYAAAKKEQIEIIGEIELAFRNIDTPCLGITGTNGKTTTTLLVHHVLQESGIRSRALGNVGIPLAAEIVDHPLRGEVVVAELSSFQLETLQSPKLDAAVITNITPDHLDRYGSLEEYAKAKISIFNRLNKNGKAFLFHSIEKEYKHLLKGYTYEVYGVSSKNHDEENKEAAFCLCHHMGVSRAQFENALKTFKKPSHRVEFVCHFKGVNYFDDSKGTNIDAVIKAIQCMQGRVILIAGGVDKGFPYASWIKPFQERVSLICTIGQAAPLMEQQLSPYYPVKRFDTLESATRYAAAAAVPGDNVLLSPGCSSYDMFRDYKHRGEVFQKIVFELAKVGGIHK